MTRSDHQAGPASGEASTGTGLLLTLLRVAIGWHFLYEGLVKILDPEWTAAGYLASSEWILGDLFRRIAASETALAVVDLANQWGLALIGAGLLLGLFTRVAAASGAVLLALYWVAHPPFLGGGVSEGSYLIVDKNLVELLALLVIVGAPATVLVGLDRWRLARRRAAARTSKAATATAEPAESAESTTASPPAPCDPVTVPGRRDLLKSFASLPFAAAFAWAFVKRKHLVSHEEKGLVDAASRSVTGITGATTRSFEFTGLDALDGPIQRSKIGDLELSRVILGGNLIGGWAHARDLIYVSKLVKAYHHDGKVFETLWLAEQCGVNTILTNPVLSRVIGEYRKRGGTIQFISDCALKGDLVGGIRMSVDNGADACYVQGGIADRLVEQGKLDEIAKAVEMIRSEGLLAGIGAHRLETVQACVEAGFRPDFWMKTLHRTNYWSARPDDQHNNIWCTDPDETVEYMSAREEPWIAFKILAAGALKPEDAFRYAFESGADFICVGMYDFQVVDDINLARQVLDGPIERTRPWRA